jgi:hypothetical protein
MGDPIDDDLLTGDDCEVMRASNDQEFPSPISIEVKCEYGRVVLIFQMN